MKIRIGLALLLLYTLFTPAKAHTVLIYGDSLSAAYGMAQEKGWVARLKQQIQPQHSVVNASISGETTGGGLARLPATLVEFQPDIVFIALGGNDALLGQPLPSIKNNLYQMINLVRDSGARPVLAGIAVPPSYGPRYLEQFRKMYVTLARETDVAFFDLYIESIANNPSLMQADGIHPNEQAQSQIQQRVAKFLQTHLLPEN